MTAGDVYEHAARAFDRSFFEQGRRDCFLRGFNGSILTARVARTIKAIPIPA